MKASNNPNMEFYGAPVIGGADIKRVQRSETMTLVVEPTSLVFGEPEPSLLKMPDGLPVDYENFKKLHGQPLQ